MRDFEQKMLLARWVDGQEVSASEIAALKSALESSPELLTAAADQIAINRLLLNREIGSIHISEKVQAKITPRKVIPFYRRPRVWGAVAAVTLMGWMTNRLLVTLQGPVAEITGSIGVENLSHKTGFRKGDVLSFPGGFVSVKFKDGAEVVLEGEAEFQFLNSNRGKLLKGSAVANVPESAYGFIIDGPGGKVIDVGTEFAVRTSGDQMEVHVLKGEVKAKANGHRSISLKEDEALLLGATGSSNLKATPRNFLTSLPPKPDGLPVEYIHWSFNEGKGTEVYAKIRGAVLPEYAKGVLSTLSNSRVIPRWTDGVDGSGIYLSGQDDYIQTDFVGFGGSSARTVSLWAKVPKDLEESESYALVSWGAHSTPGDTWQISLNPDINAGGIGSLRVGTYQGSVVGSTDLRDGEWHHLAVVLYGGRPANTATHVLIYVDGKLDPAVRKSVRVIDTDITGPKAQRVAFGKNSAVRSNADPASDLIKHTFRGTIDEVTLCPKALSQKEIQALMRTKRID